MDIGVQLCDTSAHCFHPAMQIKRVVKKINEEHVQCAQKTSMHDLSWSESDSLPPFLAQHILLTDKKVGAQVPGLTHLCVMKSDCLHTGKQQRSHRKARNPYILHFKHHTFCGAGLSWYVMNAYLHTSQNNILCCKIRKKQCQWQGP